MFFELTLIYMGQLNAQGVLSSDVVRRSRILSVVIGSSLRSLTRKWPIGHDISDTAIAVRSAWRSFFDRILGAAFV